MTREILLVAHQGRASMVQTAAQTIEILQRGGIGTRMVDTEAQWLGLSGTSVRPVADGPDAAAGCELVLVLGGDGSFLRAAELARHAAIPVLGINLGRIGFLAEVEADNLADTLEQVIARRYRLEERMTVDMAVVVEGRVVERGWALNEVSIERGPHLGVLELMLEIDGRPVSSYGCDGLLVSTPTGSTAYAFSAGGPVVWPEVQAILVVPSNAHALFSRPMVTSPDSTIAVDIDPGGRGAVLYCDGRREVALPAGGRVEITRGHQTVTWVRMDAEPFADRLVHKFELPVTGWRERGR